MTAIAENGISYTNGLTYVVTQVIPPPPPLDGGILLENTTSYCIMLEDQIFYLLQEGY